MLIVLPTWDTVEEPDAEIVTEPDTAVPATELCRVVTVFVST